MSGESRGVGAGSQLQTILEAFLNQLSPVNKGGAYVVFKVDSANPKYQWSCHNDDDDDDRHYDDDDDHHDDDDQRNDYYVYE